MTPPYVPGGAVAGRVRAVGHGVDPGWVGREVVARTGHRGGYAEQALVPADGLLAVPDGLGYARRRRCCTTGPRRWRVSRARGSAAGTGS